MIRAVVRRHMWQGKTNDTHFRAWGTCSSAVLRVTSGVFLVSLSPENIALGSAPQSRSWLLGDVILSVRSR